MKNFLLMLLDNVLRLVLWGLSLAAFVFAWWLIFQHQFVGALLAFIAFGALGGFSGYRQLTGAWIGWNRYQTRPEDELLGLSSVPSNDVSDVLDDTPFRDD